jgi:hypothetical protein
VQELREFGQQEGPTLGKYLEQKAIKNPLTRQAPRNPDRIYGRKREHNH